MNVQDNIRSEGPPPDITTLNISASTGSSLTEVPLDQLPYGTVFKIRGDPHTFVKVQMRRGDWSWVGEKNGQAIAEHMIFAFNVTAGLPPEMWQSRSEGGRQPRPPLLMWRPHLRAVRGR